MAVGGVSLRRTIRALAEAHGRATLNATLRDGGPLLTVLALTATTVLLVMMLAVFGVGFFGVGFLLASDTPAQAFTAAAWLFTAADCFATPGAWSSHVIDTDALIVSPRPPLLACGINSSPQSFWIPGRMVQVAARPDGHIGLVSVTYALEKCVPGGTQEGPRTLRYFQF